jgi:hypothetical protein
MLLVRQCCETRAGRRPSSRTQEAQVSSAEMADVVETPDKPAVRRHEDRRDAAIVDGDEGEGPGSRGDREGRADGTPVREGDHAPPRVRGRDPFDPGAYTFRQLLVGLSSRNHVPALALEHLHGYGILRDHLVAVEATFPVPEAHLAKARLDDWRQPDPTRKWSGRLVRSSQRRHIDGVDPPAVKASGDALGLFEPLGTELGISVPVEERERLGRIGWNRFAMSDKQDLGRERWRRETYLAMYPNGRLDCAFVHAMKTMSSPLNADILEGNRHPPDDASARRLRIARSVLLDFGRSVRSRSVPSRTGRRLKTDNAWTEPCACGTPESLRKTQR